MPTSKDFTYTRAPFNLFRNVTNCRNLRECRLQVRHVSVIYRHGTHCSHKSYLTLLACDFEHVFATKQCILCSTLRHKSYLTLPYVTSLLNSFHIGTFAHGFIMLLPRNLASPKGCSLAIKSILIYSSLKLILVSRAERKVVTRVTYNQLILRYDI